MISYDGKTDRQVTSSNDSESSPRWSPDGKYLSFTSSRPGKAKGNQVWLLPRAGGEAMQLTDVKGRLQGYEWSPDSTQARAGRRRSRSRRRTGRRARQAENAQADRHRPLQVQAGRAGLPAERPPQLSSICSISRPRKLDRLTTQKTWDEVGTRLVARRQCDRLHQQSRYGPGPQSRGQVYVAEAKAGVTEKALIEQGFARRPRAPGMVARWEMDRVPGRR